MFKCAVCTFSSFPVLVGEGSEQARHASVQHSPEHVWERWWGRQRRRRRRRGSRKCGGRRVLSCVLAVDSHFITGEIGYVFLSRFQCLFITPRDLAPGVIYWKFFHHDTKSHHYFWCSIILRSNWILFDNSLWFLLLFSVAFLFSLYFEVIALCQNFDLNWLSLCGNQSYARLSLF